MGPFIHLLLTLLILFGCSAPKRSFQDKQAQAFLNPFESVDPEDRKLAHFTYLINHGKQKEVLEQLKKENLLHTSIGKETLKHLALQNIYDALSKNSEELNFQACLAAFLSLNEKAISFLENRLPSMDLRLQLMCMNHLDQLKQSSRLPLAHALLSSPFLPLRAQAAIYLCFEEGPSLWHQLESLYLKVSPEERSLFANALAHLKTTSADRYVRQLLYSPHEQVRAAMIVALAQEARSDFLPEIRALLQNPSVLIQESALYAIGKLDSQAQETIEAFSHKQVPATLGPFYYDILRQQSPDIAEKKQLELALDGNLFSYFLLSPSEENQAFLVSKLQSKQEAEKLNACLALLKMGSGEAFAFLLDLLSLDLESRSIRPFYSHSQTLNYWEFYTTQALSKRKQAFQVEAALLAKKQLFINARQLPNEAFLDLSEQLIKRNVKELMPLICQSLAEHSSPKAKQILLQYRDMPGLPFVRQYCVLGLYLKRPSLALQAELITWLQSQNTQESLTIRELPLWDERQPYPFELTPSEKTQLILDVYLALIASPDEILIETLCDAMAKSPTPALFSALLLRAL